MIMISNNLKVFVQVAEKGSFTGAAGALYISQPAVSRAVKALEDELEVKLFCRDRRNGLILTEAGKKILSLALQMEDLENRIYQTAYNENHMMGGRVRIASMPILTSVILSKVFSRFRKMYPGVSVELMEGSASEIRSAIEAHEVDFGFFCSPFGNLDTRIVFTDRMLAVSESEIPEPVDLSEDSGKYILCRAGYETVLEEVSSEKIRLEHSFTCKQAETVISLVKEGNGIGILSELVLNATPNDLLRSSVSPAVEMDVGIAAIDLNDLTPSANALMRLVEEVSEEYKKAK